MKYTTWLGCFQSIRDIRNEFEITSEDLEGITLLIALYDHEDYEGYAYVLFEKDGKLYEVYGRHCSCMGLEGQWDPEETTVEHLAYTLSVGQLQGRSEYKEEMTEALQNVIREYRHDS